MTKATRTQQYIFDFFKARWTDFNLFYKATTQDKYDWMPRVKHGPKIMDLLNSMHGIIHDQFLDFPLIPNVFVSPDVMFNNLDGFVRVLTDYQPYLTENGGGTSTEEEIWQTQKMADEIIEMVKEAKKIYDFDDALIPYQELRYALIVNDIRKFIDLLKSILASVSYSITRVQEGFFHSNVHLVLRLLGFDVVSEEATNRGRIDAVIRLYESIYILEFKFDESADVSERAMAQIKATDYAEKYGTEGKDIYLLGISFGADTRNINGYKFEKVIRR